MSRIVGFRRQRRQWRHLRQLVSNKGAIGFVPKIVVIDFIIIIITVVVVVVFVVICGLEMDGERKASGAGDGGSQ